MQPPPLNTTNCLFGSTDNFPGLLETKMGLTVEMEYGAFILFINLLTQCLYRMGGPKQPV